MSPVRVLTQGGGILPVLVVLFLVLTTALAAASLDGLVEASVLVVTSFGPASLVFGKSPLI